MSLSEFRTNSLAREQVLSRGLQWRIPVGTSQSQELGAVQLPIEASRRVSVFGDVSFIFLAGTEFIAKGEEEPLPV